MRKVPLAESLRIIARGSLNWLTERPVVVSFEVTDSCTCWCRHCDHGGPKDASSNMKPADYRRYMDILRPVVVQVSGGEPLMRGDLPEVVRNIKSDSGLPFTILVSNWSLMREERYLELRAAGVDEFCVSLDFPDERHDDFRKHPGLFKHLNEIVPRLAALGHDDIVMNNCITSANVNEINRVADKAREWGVNINFSAYSPRRTGCRDFFLNTPEQMAILDRELGRIRSRIDRTHWITNNETTLAATCRYFAAGGAPSCKAGLRWLVVTSNGYLQPCSMQFHRYDVTEQARMVSEFTRNNRCDECYVSIRSYLDKGFPQLLRENVMEFFSLNSRRQASAKAAPVQG
ncbi:MAG TPA: radical SAM protein [Acidobacteriota bacterium]|nr:radical SAM protein [Acidobacteriota bacterium]